MHGVRRSQEQLTDSATVCHSAIHSGDRWGERTDGRIRRPSGGGTTMRLSTPARLARFALASALVLALGVPAAGPVAAADPVVLKLGTTQAIDSVNPYQSALVESYEAFELSYDQLVGFGPDLEPAPAFAESWSRNTDGKAWTFKFRPDLKWSDGQPATSADACFSWQ